MLAIIIFVLVVNCFRAIEHGDCHNARRHKYVETIYGKVRGHSADDGEYVAFLGIPYASPPLGKNRFRAPKPPKSWQGIYDAIRTVKCPQKGEGSEDCLILNVFTPIKLKTFPLPVLVYIHGGSYLMGSGPIKGMDSLIKQNIIVVTINYRLGALGFLCLGINEAPGNAGLKDQLAALRWIKDNIVFFGGNPNQITIYGMSAGGASVELLVLSQTTPGLFNKAIVESASATSVWAVDPKPLSTARTVAKLVDFPETTFMEILIEYYKYMDVNALTEANYYYYNNLTDGTFGFVPCVEKELTEEKALIKDSPYEILMEGKYFRVPIMFLYASMEGLYLRSAEYYNAKYKERMESNFIEFMPADLVFEKENIRKETVEQVRHFYFGNKTNIGLTKYLEYFGDSLVLHGLLNSADSHALHGNPVHLMEFGYKGGLGNDERNFEELSAAGHGDMVKYAILNGVPKGEGDKTTVRRVTTLIGNYVKHGDPTPVATSLLPVIWPRVRPGNLSYLYLDHDFEVDYNPYEARISFWDRLYARFRLKIKPVSNF